MTPIEEITIQQAHDGFRCGDFGAKDLTAAFLDRIKRLDKTGPNINAMMALSTTALDEATLLDEYFRETGRFKGRLHGIPFVVKDQVRSRPLGDDRLFLIPASNLFINRQIQRV